MTKIHLKLSPLIVWVAFLIINIYFEFQVYMFNNGRDVTKCHFLHNNDCSIADAKAIAIPRVFSENSQAKIVLLASIFLLS